MENQKFVVWTQFQAELVKFKGFDEEGKEIGESMTLGDAIDSEKWERDPADDDLWKSFKVIHPDWALGFHTDTNDVRLKFEGTDTWVDAFKVTFLMKPNRLNHPRNERAWIKRIIIGGDTTLKLLIPNDWPADKFWAQCAHRKVSELKAGDVLFDNGREIDGEDGELIIHHITVMDVKPVGRLQMQKLEVTTNEDSHSKTIWIDGIPFTRPFTKEELDQLEAMDRWENGQED